MSPCGPLRMRLLNEVNALVMLFLEKRYHGSILRQLPFMKGAAAFSKIMYLVRMLLYGIPLSISMFFTSLFDKIQEICCTRICKIIIVTAKKGGEPLSKNKYQFESKIHVYRATKRMTQQELADLAGVSRQTIMQLERNRYNPSMLLAYSIAKVFGVTIEDLFDFKEEQ